MVVFSRFAPETFDSTCSKFCQLDSLCKFQLARKASSVGNLSPDAWVVPWIAKFDAIFPQRIPRNSEEGTSRCDRLQLWTSVDMKPPWKAWITWCDTCETYLSNKMGIERIRYNYNHSYLFFPFLSKVSICFSPATEIFMILGHW